MNIDPHYSVVFREASNFGSLRRSLLPPRPYLRDVQSGFLSDGRGGLPEVAEEDGPELDARIAHGSFNLVISDRLRLHPFRLSPGLGSVVSSPTSLSSSTSSSASESGVSIFALLDAVKNPCDIATRRLQMINHLPNAEALTNKGNLIR